MKIRDIITEQGVQEGHANQQKTIVKKNGKPVGEIGIDRESSPGVGQYYMKHYASGTDNSGYDSREEALDDLRHVMKQSIYGELREQGVAEGKGNNKISFKVQKGKNKFATTLSINNKPAGVYQYDANSGRSIAEVYPKYKGKGFGKILILHAIYTAAKLGMDFVEDESRTAEYDNVLDSLSSNGYIVDDDGYWYVTGEGEQFLKQRLKQGVAEGQAGKEDLRKIIVDILERIYFDASSDDDMTDVIADQLGDYYRAVKVSGDAVLKRAYADMRDTADAPPKEQATVALAGIQKLMGPGYRPQPRPPLSPEQNAQVDAFVNQFKAALASQGIRAHPDWNKDKKPGPGVAEAIDIGSEWMTDTELDQYVPDQLQQQWRELVGYDAEGNVSALWANITGGYEPDVNDPADRANMVKVANKWFAMKRIPNVRFFDVRDVGDELEWLVQIGAQGVAEAVDPGRRKFLQRTAGAAAMAAAPKQTLGAIGKISQQAANVAKAASTNATLRALGAAAVQAVVAHHKEFGGEIGPRNYDGDDSGYWDGTDADWNPSVNPTESPFGPSRIKQTVSGRTFLKIETGFSGDDIILTFLNDKGQPSWVRVDWVGSGQLSVKDVNVPGMKEVDPYDISDILEYGFDEGMTTDPNEPEEYSDKFRFPSYMRDGKEYEFLVDLLASGATSSNSGLKFAKKNPKWVEIASQYSSDVDYGDDNNSAKSAVADVAKSAATSGVRTQTMAGSLTAFKELVNRVLDKTNINRKKDEPAVKDMGRIEPTTSAPALPAPDRSAADIMAQLRDVVGRDLTDQERAVVAQEVNRES